VRSTHGPSRNWLEVGDACERTGHTEVALEMLVVWYVMGWGRGSKQEREALESILYV
jgi:hypothetical protein